jgi:hypothetical protein
MKHFPFMVSLNELLVQNSSHIIIIFLHLFVRAFAELFARIRRSCCHSRTSGIGQFVRVCPIVEEQWRFLSLDL